MLIYASRTGTLRNLAAMKAHGWGLLLTPHRDLSPSPGFRRVLDNGKWGAHLSGQPWDGDLFMRAVDRVATTVDWLVVPDVVADGPASFECTTTWLPRLVGAAPLMIAVQDGMTTDQVAHLVDQAAGVFVGGSTAWKEASLPMWGAWCAERGKLLHVARVNTGRRMALANAASAHSVDASSGSLFALTIPMLDNHRRQPDLFAPARGTP